jgi:4-hydroxy-3-methylbut-2-enyl diphosphate reductase IspH
LIEKSENIGVTAGASTPENIIKSVIEKIEKI